VPETGLDAMELKISLAPAGTIYNYMVKQSSITAVSLDINTVLSSFSVQNVSETSSLSVIRGIFLTQLVHLMRAVIHQRPKQSQS
jgi:hypothetical protein